MEVLEEFDWEYPLTFTFCELISEEAFERQAVSYTERSLRRLFRSMDRNPALGERVVRKWKQEERERSGLTSFLAGRFFKALQGDLNYYNSVGALELQQRLDILKRRMQKLNIYAQEARRKKRKRRSHRLDHSPSTGGSVLSRSPGASTTSTRPPIPVTYMPRVFGPFPSLSDEQTETLAGPNSEMKVVQLNWTGLSSSPKRMVDLTPLVLNPGGFHSSRLSGNSTHKLQTPGFPWSPGLGSTTNPEDLAPTVGNASVFTPPVLLKFQPAPRPQEDAESDCDSKNLNSPSKAPQ
ncbi:uncharacterized protein LOC130458171 isoform X2 [Monodelphis domestica]|uniref:uncharacterized protein LOC130458171 isoform X2 n=1 Tax=Monodelphis domestica TaxID=13616 RepID=UPI0024E2716B|nr:uncharacterized protein LOC130458171 isoform X2 [Monodelphis domestica]